MDDTHKVADRAQREVAARWSSHTVRDRRRVLLGGVLLLIGLMLVPPDPAFVRTNDWLMSGVSGMRPAHAFVVGGLQLPLEARTTGIYAGITLNVALARWYRAARCRTARATTRSTRAGADVRSDDWRRGQFDARNARWSAPVCRIEHDAYHNRIAGRCQPGMCAGLARSRGRRARYPPPCTAYRRAFTDRTYRGEWWVRAGGCAATLAWLPANCPAEQSGGVDRAHKQRAACHVPWWWLARAASAPTPGSHAPGVRRCLWLPGSGCAPARACRRRVTNARRSLSHKKKEYDAIAKTSPCGHTRATPSNFIRQRAPAAQTAASLNYRGNHTYRAQPRPGGLPHD